MTHCLLGFRSRRTPAFVGGTRNGGPRGGRGRPRIQFVLFCAALAVGCHTGLTAPVPSTRLPGLQPDGFTVLHNQWLIRPVGAQVELDDFPVNLAIDHSGRFAAVLHAGFKKHELCIIDLRTRQTTALVPVHETFYGLAFSPDGRTLVCSGGGDEVLHVFAFHRGTLTARPDVRIAPADDPGVVAGVAFAPDGHAIVASLLFDSKIVCVDLSAGRVRWTTRLDPANFEQPPRIRDAGTAPNAGLVGSRLDEQDNPLAMAWDAHRGRIYTSLWGQSAVAVLDAANGAVLTRWAAGLHPNELLLTSDGRHLLVSNGGRNTVTILDTATGKAVETLCSALAPDDQPGSTPDSLALTPDGRTLFAANAYNSNIAVFDVSTPGAGRPLGFIPTGWFPTSVRLTPKGDRLLVVSARGLAPKPNATGPGRRYTYIAGLYRGSLGIIDLPRGKALDRALAAWTLTAQHCRPEPPPAATDGPIPAHVGDPSPIRHVIYVIKENRTYDQVFGDVAEGNGDSRALPFSRSGNAQPACDGPRLRLARQLLCQRRGQRQRT